MNMISKILIGIGLLTTVVGNLATRYGINAFSRALLEESGAGAIGALIRAIDMALTYNAVSLLGCALLIVGLALAAMSRRQRP